MTTQPSATCPKCGATPFSPTKGCALCGYQPSDAPPARAAALPKGKDPKRTMIGMPALQLSGSEGSESAASEEGGEAPAPAPAETKRKASPKGTLLGVAGLDAAELRAMVEARTQEAQSAESQGASPSHSPPPAKVLQKQRTIQGMAAGGYGASLSGAEPSLSGIGGLQARPKPSRKSVVFAAAGAFVLLLLLIWWWQRDSSGIRAQILHDEQGESMRIEIPDAAPKSYLRFEGKRYPLKEGKATLPLPLSGLKAGENTLSLEVVDAQEGARQEELHLTLDYRIRTQLELKTGEPPDLRVFIDALPGSRIKVENKTVNLNPEGKGEVRLPLGRAAKAKREGNAQSVVRYAVILPSGQQRSGRVLLDLPYARVEWERAAGEVVTERDAYRIRGKADPSATVHANGQPLKLDKGEFSYRMPLPTAGRFDLRIEVQQKDHLPFVGTLRIRRVEDLGAEAEAFQAEAGTDYAAAKAQPEALAGKRAAFEGRLYNSRNEEGHSVLQLLVNGCGAGKRCPLWVNYPGVLELRPPQNVRVFGKLAGQQQFRSDAGRVVTVPRLDAIFVLPKRSAR